MTQNLLQNIRIPPLSKRGVAILSIIGTASVFIALNGFVHPHDERPPAPQVIVVTIPAQPTVLKIEQPANACPFLGLTP